MKSAVSTRLAVIFLLCHCYNTTMAQSISGVINSYYSITSVNAAAHSLTLPSTTGLVPGTKVLIIQMKGATIDNSNTAAFGNVTSINAAGNYEFNVICGVTGNEVVLRYELTRTYDNAGSIQLIPVPQYNIITVSDTVKADPWNASTGKGGVIVFEADTIYLNSAISASGQGFAGAAFVNFPTPTYNCNAAFNITNYFLQLAPVPNLNYSGGPKGEGIAAFIANAEYGRGKQANGGGGGNNHNTGGGGGANWGTGGNGGQRSNESIFNCHGTNPGIGGLSLSSFGYSSGNNRIFLGGGGGSGHQNNAKGTPGGNGGGIVLVTANVIIGSGTSILADGLSPVNLTNNDPYTAEGDGGGGGGAGGSIILDINEVIGSINAIARGGRGSNSSSGVSDCTGPGGGGGGGVVWTKGPGALPNVSTTLTGGNNGVISPLATSPCVGQANGATAGNAGNAIAGYTAPAMGSLVCSPLPISQLKFFKARAEEKDISLWWNMRSIEDIQGYEVERSNDQVTYSLIAYVRNNGSYAFSITDKDNLSGTVFYRLKLIHADGTVAYSAIVPVTKTPNTAFSGLNIFPNPVAEQLKVSMRVRNSVKASISIFNSSGQLVHQEQHALAAGYNIITIPVSRLSRGVYWLLLEGNGMQERKRFIRHN
jgi:Secretion system C-terminal sorting domain